MKPKKPYDPEPARYRAMLFNQARAAEEALNGSKQQEEQEHGVTCYYSGGPGESYYQPVMECSCGFSTGRECSWSNAGEGMDFHLREAKLNEGR